MHLLTNPWAHRVCALPPAGPASNGTFVHHHSVHPADVHGGGGVQLQGRVGGYGVGVLHRGPCCAERWGCRHRSVLQLLRVCGYVKEQVIIVGLSLA